MDSQEVAETEKYFRALEERLQNEIRSLAEAVSSLDSKLSREFGALREEMHREFAETKALLRPWAVGEALAPPASGSAP
jgi:hypothetical protein